MLRVAIVGAGAVSAIHAEGFLAYPDLCQVCVVCDTHAEKAGQLIANKKLPADICTSYEELLARTDIDAVSLCVPQSVHANHAEMALYAGKHVLVEKPMAASLEECDAMIAAQRKSGKLLSIVSQNRYKVPTMKVKAMLDAKVGGKVQHATINSLWWRGDHYYDLAWRGRWETEGGGSVTNQSVHHLDLMQWMLGMPERVTAVIRNVAHDNSECEDSAVAIFEYPDKLVQFTSNLVTHGEEQELIFQTQRGRLSVPWKPLCTQALPNGFPEDNQDAMQDLLKIYDDMPEIEQEGHVAQIGNFLRAIKGGEPLMVDGPEGKKAVELIAGIYKSAVTRSTVTFPLLPDDPFYKKEAMAAQMPRFHEKTRNIESMPAMEISFGRNVGR